MAIQKPFLLSLREHWSQFRVRCLLLLAGSLCAASLLACGGGSSTSSVTVAPTTPVAVTSVQTLSGTAAVGAPVAGGNVSIQCAAGSSLASSTSAGGTWTVNISGQSFPCIITVSGGNTSLTIHSIALDTGSVNVTPLTDLIVAAAAGGDPSAWLTSHSNGLADALAALVARLQNAQTDIKVKLQAAGYTVPSGDGFTAKFSPAAGDPYDDLLEKIKNSLEDAGLAYSDLVAVLSSAGTSTVALPYAGVITTTQLAAMPQINSASLAISGKVMAMKTYATSGSPAGGFVGGGTGNKAVFQVAGFNGMKLKDFTEMKLELKSVSTPPSATDGLPPYIAVNLMIDLNCDMTPLSTTATIAQVQARHRLLTFDPYYPFILADATAISTTQFKTITFGPDTGGWRVSGGVDVGLPNNPAPLLQDTLASTLNAKFNYTDYPNACIVDGISADNGMFRDTTNATCNTGGSLPGTAPAVCGKPHSGVFLFLGRSAASLDAEWQVRKISVNKGTKTRSFTFQ